MNTRVKLPHLLLFLSFLLIFSGNILAHCDSMEGPVVKASRQALETGNINYVLIWVRQEDEAEVRGIFVKVTKVRTLSQEAKDLADLYFFESVVRIHRMGEGVSYTGLKPVDYEPAAGIEAADIAIRENSITGILDNVAEEYHSELKASFNELQSKSNYGVDDLTAGREYVEAYVHFIHYVEALFSGQPVRDEHKS